MRYHGSSARNLITAEADNQRNAGVGGSRRCDAGFCRSKQFRAFSFEPKTGGFRAQPPLAFGNNSGANVSSSSPYDFCTLCWQFFFHGTAIRQQASFQIRRCCRAVAACTGTGIASSSRAASDCLSVRRPTSNSKGSAGCSKPSQHKRLC